MRRRKSRSISNHVNNTLKVLKDFRIPKSDDAVTLFLEFICSLLITEQVSWRPMLPAIEFDHQFAVMAGKVGNTSANWRLPAKMAIFRFEKPQLLPQLLFRLGDVAAKFTRKLVGH